MSVILCICMLAGVCGCANQKGNVGDSTDDTSSGMNQEPLTLVSQNRSEYVVIYDGEDDDAKTFVGELVSMIYSATGVLIQTVDIDVSSKTYENEIIVGNARDTVADVVSSAADEDFIVAIEHFQNLHALLHTHRNVLNARVRIDHQAILPGKRHDFLARLIHLEHAAPGVFYAQNHVF